MVLSGRRQRAIFWTALTLIFFILAWHFAITHGYGKKTYQSVEKQNAFILTEVHPPNSFDPLHADFGFNLPSARMRYLTPVEVNEGDSLSSTILEKFIYNDKTQQMRWTVRRGLTFQDGQPIRPEEVVLAVTRMLRSRPNFPVIKHIDGKDEWISSGAYLNAMPRGIQVRGDEITIQLRRNVRNPFFRFALEIFSIIPASCIDLETSTLKCEIPPASGYYDFAEGAGVNGERVAYRRRDETAKFLSRQIPQEIEFIYAEHQNPLRLFESNANNATNVVIATNSELLPEDVIQGLKGRAIIKQLPKARFGYFVLNPNLESFRTAECRRIFADKFRVLSEAFFTTKSSRSIFPNLLPGHLPDTILADRFPIGGAEKCKQQLKKFSPTWLRYAANDRPPTAFDKTVKATFDELGIKPREFYGVVKNEDHESLFLENKHHIKGGSLGYWALDPAGDIEMMFTPDMHKHLNVISTDPKLQEFIERLIDNPVRENYEAFNAYLYESAIFNVFNHFGRAYISNVGKNLNRAPMAITSAYPWHLFEE